MSSTRCDLWFSRRPVSRVIRSPSALVRIVGPLLLVLLLAGCATGTGSDGRLSAPPLAETAASPLPGTRAVPHHPDSLVNVDLTKKDGSASVGMASGWSVVEERTSWSARLTMKGASRTNAGRPTQFATLHSLDLALAPLASRDSVRAQEVETLMQRYRSALRFTICLFDDRPEDVGRLGEKNTATVVLRTDRGTEIRAQEVRFMTSGSAASVKRQEYRVNARPSIAEGVSDWYYRCYAAAFKREQEDGDILANVNRLSLRIGRAVGPGASSTVQWSLPNEARPRTP